MKRLSVLCLLLVVVGSAAIAQDKTPTPEPETPQFAFEFPLAHSTAEQIEAAYACELDPEAAEALDVDLESATACEIAAAALALAHGREGDEEPPSEDEIALFTRLLELNPALTLHLPILATYYDAAELVDAPDFTHQPVVAMHLTYTFTGLGPSNNYDVTITSADDEPVVSGTVTIEGGYSDETPGAPVSLPDSVDSAVVQAFGAALTDLVPIGQQFSTIPCWDYYPDWSVELTFEDGTVITMANNASNAVGIGGPWQVEIDGLNYMQYSYRFPKAIRDLFSALRLPFGETAAMGCGGGSDPLFDSYPRTGDNG